MPIASNEIKNAGFQRGAASFAGAAFLSRVLGFVRDAAVVWLFGAGWVSDAFFAAFRVANFVRRTIGEGALNAAFMPALAREKERGGRGFFGAAFGWLLWSSLGAALLLALFARPVMLVTAFGLSNRPEAFALAVTLSRIMCWQLVPVLLSSLCQGVVYHYGKIFSAAAAPVLFSAFAILYLAGGKFYGGLSPAFAVKGLAVAGLAGAAAGLFVLLRLARGFGERPALFPARSPEAAVALTAALPALLCSTADQITMFTDMVFASFLQSGSITAVYNATRLMQFPLVLVGVSSATAALAAMAKAGAGGRADSVKEVLSSSIRSSLFLLVPAAAGLMAFDMDICVALFGHGQFSMEAARTTASALFYCAVGLPAYGVSKIMVMAFYSLSDWKSPLRLTLLQVALDVTLAMLLLGGLGVAGLALAGAISAWLGACGLALLLARRGVDMVKDGLACLARCAFCASLMYVLCLWLQIKLAGLSSISLVALVAPLGAGFYFLSAWLLRSPELYALTERQ